MSITFDSSLPPLPMVPPPVVPIDALLAVETVTLAAADVPRGVLREFYTVLLGLAFVEADQRTVRFVHQNRHIHLDRDFPGPGQCALVIRNFSEALVGLRERHVSHEVLHSDAGLSRTAILRDPAGNWIHLVETRPF
jgi:hypothetical protein